MLQRHLVPEIINKEARPEKIAEILHDGTCKEQDLFPVTHEHHLTFDVKSLVHVLNTCLLYTSPRPRDS